MKRIALLTALMTTLTMVVVLTVASAAMATPSSKAAWGTRTAASKTGGRSAAVYGPLRFSEGPTPLLGGSALSPSFSEDDEADGIAAGSLALGPLVVFLVCLVGSLMAAGREPRRMRTIYEYSRLERPG